MNPKLRALLAVVAGVALAMIIVTCVEALGHAVYPVPEGLDFKDQEIMAVYIAGLPAGAFAFVIVGWALATFGGGLLAAWVARSRPRLHTGIIACVMLLATAANFAMIPHPTWFAVLAVLAIVAAAWIAGIVAARFSSPRATASA